MELNDYLKTLSRSLPEEITVGGITQRMNGFVVCRKTKRIGQIGFGHRRSLEDKPIKGEVIGSYTCPGGGGYFMRRFDNDKIIQVQSFSKKKGEK